ncbi:hypothetical protein PFICI_09504 [Pestalotiopsis fici W106-1]|uniref:Amidohydrolase-related domain-containing protein n=1 Tax=Pestalotiopsis fici (strain W106-1 / CGMCC3.15140) TaxID=1229662 RepID=W3X3C9_PESFW|nr:uncharacterized protein PFICI_09504 [Pestalotiopsis fici W106-1]ETS79651.1 hypothetical protein PFICI_09504 [Pestalotiopsis fici W106-1]
MSDNQAAQTSLLPPGAFDTHVHVFDPNLGPYHPSRAYTPADAPLSDLLGFLTSLTTSRKSTNIVLVQPSPYRTDNKVLLAALGQLQLDASVIARGIAVVDLDSVSESALGDMHAAGIRGLRLNLQSDGRDVDMELLYKNMHKAANLIQSLPGWKLQIFCRGSMWERLYSIIVDLPVQVIADHIGGLLGSSKLQEAATPADALHQPGFRQLLDLARLGRVVIKVSALYRSSDETATTYADMAPIISKLAQEAPDSLIWASDWPHTGEGANRVGGKNLEKIEEFRKIDDAAILTKLREWVGDEQVWHKMMVVNPKRVFY